MTEDGSHASACPCQVLCALFRLITDIFSCVPIPPIMIWALVIFGISALLNGLRHNVVVRIRNRRRYRRGHG